jgi:hypothetical protein
MIIPEQKKAVSVILSRMNSNGKEEQVDVKPTASTNNESLHAIAEDLLHAIHSRDAAAVMQALKAFSLENETAEDEEE